MNTKDLVGKICFSILGVALAVALSGGVVAQPAADDTCTLFGVQDTEQADSMLFRVHILDPLTGDVLLLTPIRHLS